MLPPSTNAQALGSAVPSWLSNEGKCFRLNEAAVAALKLLQQTARGGRDVDGYRA
jgi:hypothetical protein